MDFIPYKAHECFDYLYYPIPMELFFNKKYKGKIKSAGKLLYGFLLNRLSLSAKNKYVGKIDHDEDLIKLIRKNYEFRIVKSTIQDTKNLRSNYNNNNYNNRGKKNNYQNYEQRQ